MSTHVNYLRVLPGGRCFAHGLYTGPQCPKWPSCATDPKDPEQVRLGTEEVARSQETGEQGFQRGLALARQVAEMAVETLNSMSYYEVGQTFASRVTKFREDVEKLLGGEK